MMDGVDVRATELDEVEAEAQRVLDRRSADIVDGHLDGEHWFIALLKEAKSIIAHREALDARRDDFDRT